MKQRSLPPESHEEPQEGPIDPSRFAALFQQNYTRFWVLASAILGDRHQAEDIVQEAAVVALTRLHQFEPGTNFLAWVSTIVRFQAFNWSRKRTRRGLRNTDPALLDDQPNRDPLETWELEPDGHMTSDQMLFDDAVMNALNSLGEIPRACLLIRTVHQLSYAEISNMLDIPEGTAMSHVHRAKTQLREHLQNMKLSSSMR